MAWAILEHLSSCFLDMLSPEWYYLFQSVGFAQKEPLQ